jgi:large subunit ribosomal protein L13
MVIIDGKDCVLGRVATYAAKMAFEGEQVSVINAGDLVIIGDKNGIVSDYRNRLEIGTMSKGPVQQRTVEGIVKRAIKGMMHRKTPRGREAIGRVKVYAGVPEDLKVKESIVVAKMRMDKPVHRLKISELSNILKYKEI